MNKSLFFVAGLLSHAVCAQRGLPADPPRALPNWPLVVTVQFHNLSVPFRNLGGVFSNIGIGVGTEVNYNRRGNLFQNVQVGYNHNRALGDGLFVQTQAGYRPHVGAITTELKMGVGWLYAFGPSPVMVQHDGQWQTQPAGGKPLLVVPLGVSLHYVSRRHPNQVAPFVGYQLALAAGYNPSIPLVPYQFLQFGSKISF